MLWLYSSARSTSELARVWIWHWWQWSTCGSFFSTSLTHSSSGLTCWNGVSGRVPAVGHVVDDLVVIGKCMIQHTNIFQLEALFSPDGVHLQNGGRISTCCSAWTVSFATAVETLSGARQVPCLPFMAVLTFDSMGGHNLHACLIFSLQGSLGAILWWGLAWNKDVRMPSLSSGRGHHPMWKPTSCHPMISLSRCAGVLCHWSIGRLANAWILCPMLYQAYVSWGQQSYGLLLPPPNNIVSALFASSPTLGTGSANRSFIQITL